jgi:hypothetical protein
MSQAVSTESTTRKLMDSKEIEGGKENGHGPTPPRNEAAPDIFRAENPQPLRTSNIVSA